MNSSVKGGEFERAQAKLLSLWASEGRDKDLLWRTGMSGGRHTIGALKGHGYGDLQVLKPAPEALLFMDLFCVELKHYKKFDIQSEWLNEKSKLKAWWDKLKRESAQNNVQPMLIVSPDRKPILIMFDHRRFVQSCGRFLQSTLDRFELVFGPDHIIGFRQSQFFEQISLSDFKVYKRRPR